MAGGSPLDVLSGVGGIAWPAIPNLRGCQLLALQYQLEQSQWLSPEETLARQIKQISLLLQHAYANVPFYRERWDAAGLAPSAIRGPEDWRKLPLLTRFDIQLAGDRLRATGGVTDHGALATAFTSGSTGQPIEAVSTSVTRLFWNVMTLRQHLWHGRDFRLKLAAIRSLDHGVTDGAQDHWGSATTDVVATGPSVALDIHADIERQAEWLESHDPDYLLTYPSNLYALARRFERGDRRLTRLQEARSFGEVLEPRVREICQRVWGVPVIDVYSAEEVGYIAIQCPKSDNLHVQAETVLFEVLNDDGTPAAPGEMGRVVLTALHQFARPLIRYEIGDYAELAPGCVCGRGLPTLRRILGRQRNIAILPDGSRRWPAIELSDPAALRDFPPIAQFQLIQRTLHAAELLLVTARPLTSAEEDLVRSWARQALGYPLDITLTYVHEIPRAARGKFEDFRCEVATAMD